MQKEENFSASADTGVNFSTNLEYCAQNSAYHARQSSSYDQQQKWQHQQQQQPQLIFETSNGISTDMPAVDRTLSFADVMQLADLGPKLALHPNSHQQSEGDNTGVDPVDFLKFPVLSHNNSNNTDNCDGGFGVLEEIRGDFEQEEDGAAGASDNNNPLQLEFLASNNNASVTNNIVDISGDKIAGANDGGGVVCKNNSSNNKRKRPRTIKTSEEVESQRMTHIAVERNRRKQMNEHLRVLRSLMPSSYVQRGDQASIIGGAIEFVRELEQLLQCLESQKRRRLYGEEAGAARAVGDAASPSAQLGFPPPLPTGPSHNQVRIVDELDPTIASGGAILEEESAESKSCIADVEVKMLGFDALIKILSRRRPSQLIKAIAALEDLHLTILHTNITTIEQTVLYTFNVKVASEAQFTAEDIASSVQHIFTFIHANSDII